MSSPVLFRAIFRRSLPLWVALLSAASLAAQSDSSAIQPGFTLSLDTAFTLAEQQNLDLVVARIGLEDTRETVIQERAPLLPTVNLEAQQTRSAFANFGPFAGPPEQGQINTGAGIPPFNQFDIKLTANAPLLDAAAIARFGVARFDRDIAELQFEDTIQDVYLGVARAYMTHLRNLEQLRVIDANIARDRVLLDLATAQVEAGVATPIDATRAEVQLANNLRDRLQIETTVMQSDLELKNLLRLDYERTLGLRTLPEDELPLTGDLRSAVRNLLSERPDYRQLERTLERNELARRAAGLQQLPVIRVFGEYGYVMSDPTDFDDEDQWIVGLSLSVPLFDGFQIRTDKRRADLLIAQTEASIDNLERNVEAEYRLAIQDVRSLHQQIALAQRSVELSTQELELAQARFEQGVADNRDVVEAQANLAAASFILVEAEYAYNLSRLTLARIRGNVRTLAQ